MSWKLTGYDKDHLKVQHPSGKFYGAMYFNRLSKHTPDQIQGVEVLESWSGGGEALISWSDGTTEQVIFGRRKPGTAGEGARMTGGRNSFRNRNRRRGRV